MTLEDGVYSVGNCLHVHDLVDYVSETAQTAGRAAAGSKAPRELLDIEQEGFLYLVPQKLDLDSLAPETVFYFRTAMPREAATLDVTVDGEVVFSKKYQNLKPPEMERVEVPLSPKKGQTVKFFLSGREVK